MNSVRARKPTWEKIGLILQLFDEGFEFVFWMDIDSLFMNFDISIEERLPVKEKDFVFSGDTNLINAGHFIFKNTKWSRVALKAIWDMGPVNIGMGTGDNACFSIWLAGGRPEDSFERKAEFYDKVDQGSRDPTMRKKIENGQATELIAEPLRAKVQMVKKSLINSYARDFRPGDFVIHFPNSNDKIRNYYTTRLLNEAGRPLPVSLYHKACFQIHRQIDWASQIGQNLTLPMFRRVRDWNSNPFGGSG